MSCKEENEPRKRIFFRISPCFHKDDEGLIRFNPKFCLVAIDLVVRQIIQMSRGKIQGSRTIFTLAINLIPNVGFKDFCRARKTFFL